jgi:sterol desaturase/sphingolipid hydroxylase (fatty acid hydroxylase superfamily)
MITALVCFWLLVFATLALDGWRTYGAKPAREWVLDLAGLAVQGWVIPLLQIALVVAGLRWIAPGAEGVLQVTGWFGFLLAFVAVDYLYYWNHRLLHGRALWSIHRVHHTVSAMDVLGTARNTLWTSLAIVYLWAHGAMLFLLGGAGASGYLAGVTLTVAMDLWRHSAVGPRPGSPVSWLFIAPADHAWHHSAAAEAGNFGANLSLWDRLHGTYLVRDELPPAIGVATGRLPLWRQLLWPFEEAP